MYHDFSKSKTVGCLWKSLFAQCCVLEKLVFVEVFIRLRQLVVCKFTVLSAVYFKKDCFPDSPVGLSAARRRPRVGWSEGEG